MPIELVAPRPGATIADPSSFFAAGMRHINSVNYWSPYQCDEVCLIATFEVDSDGTPMFVSYGREDQMDAFIIEDANEATKQLFREHKGRICAIYILAYDRQGPFVKFGSKYDIDSDARVALFPHNPSPETIAGMHHGSYFVVEGAYVDFTAKDFGGTWSISAEDQIYLVETDSVKEPRFASGVLEHLQSKKPIPGERVHMVVYKNTEFDCLKSTHDAPYLVTPDASRLATYNRLRIQIAILLRRVESYLLRGQWHKARCLLAQIRVMECTFDEKQRVKAFQAKFPPGEAPFWTPESLYAKRFMSAFGIGLERLTLDEVTGVAHKVFDGRLTTTKKSRHTDPVILLRHMVQGNVSDAQSASVIASGITGRFERLQKLPRASVRNRLGFDCRVLECSLREACDYDNETLVSAVTGLIDTYLSDSLSTGQRAMLEYACGEAFRTIHRWQRQKFSAVQCITKAQAKTWLEAFMRRHDGGYSDVRLAIENIIHWI